MRKSQPHPFRGRHQTSNRMSNAHTADGYLSGPQPHGGLTRTGEDPPRDRPCPSDPFPVGRSSGRTQSGSMIGFVPSISLSRGVIRLPEVLQRAAGCRNPEHHPQRAGAGCSRRCGTSPPPPTPPSAARNGGPRHTWGRPTPPAWHRWRSVRDHWALSSSVIDPGSLCPGFFSVSSVAQPHR